MYVCIHTYGNRAKRQFGKTAELVILIFLFVQGLNQPDIQTAN